MVEILLRHSGPILSKDTKVYAGASVDKTVADLHSKIFDAPPPRSNFLYFHAVFGKCMQITGWRRLGNSGSAAAK